MAKKKKETTAKGAPGGIHRAVPIILAALAVFIAICYITKNEVGMLGHAISGVFLGLFSAGAYFIPPVLAVHAFFYLSDIREKRLLSRIIFSLLTVIAVSVMSHAIASWNVESPAFDVVVFYTEGCEVIGGGFIGGILGFLLMTFLGKVGVIILSAVILLIYVIFFFSKGSTLLELGRTFLYGLFAVLAFFEKGIKKLIGLFKSSKDKKLQGESRDRCDALADDEFFDVDNGIAQLEVSALGIAESRSAESIESNPTLHDKVHHRSEQPQSSEKLFTYSDTTDDEPRESTEDESKGGRVFRDIIIESENEAEDIPAAVITSDSADSIFTRDFDPYDIATAEQLSNKPSSRSASGTTVTESIRDITEEQYEEHQRAAEFERRKRALVEEERLRRENEQRSAEASAHRDEVHKTVEFHIDSTESIIGPRIEDDEVTLTVEKSESEITAAPRRSEPTDERGIYETVYAPVGRRDEGEFKPYSVPESRDDDGLLFEIGGEDKRDELVVERTIIDVPIVEAASYEPVKTKTVDEDDTYIVAEDSGDTLALFDEDAEEDTISAEPDEDEVLEDVEDIPPEEQNPFVKEARGMFDMFRNEDAADEPDSQTDATVTAQDRDFASYENEDDGDTEDELVNAEDDEDDIDEEPPFEFLTRSAPRADAERSNPEPEPEPKKKADYLNFSFPPIDLLSPDEDAVDETISEEIREKSRIIIETLASLNVTASIKAVDRGPRITRYEVVPARGVRVNQVTSCYNDIVLNLETEGVRMLSPIPGKAAIGFEVPNKKQSMVRLRGLIESEEFRGMSSKTAVCMGKDVGGVPVFADIAKMPHALIAGATGMGKSVCINSLMISMLYKARPDEVKFIMIDPKQVEFTMYNGIPHLLVPIVTDVKQAAGALMWAVEEMERRYGVLQAAAVRNIDAYNEKLAYTPSLGEPMPRIVIVIDEFAELIMQAKNPVESLVIRIAQKARAAGIHLIIGTQKPVKEVITGLIKSNIPSKLSCKVASNRDSILIFDEGGAEKLLDKGDMLISFANSIRPQRVQCAFVSDREVETVMDYLKQFSDGAQYDEAVMEEINKAAKKCAKKSGADDDDDGDDESGSYYGDPEFLDAVETAIRAKKVSASMLQTKMKIGFQKASRYVSQMEDIGIVSEPNGSKPRDVLITMDEWLEKLNRMDV